MFEQYSEAARRTIFISLKIAKRRGAPEIGLEDLVEALVREDQGPTFAVDAAEMAHGAAIPVAAIHRPFLTEEIARAIHHGLQPLMPVNDVPSPTSTDLPLSAAIKKVLMLAYMFAYELSEGLRDGAAIPAEVEPLHLLAVVLADEGSEVAKIVKQAGVERQTVMAAIRSGPYSK